MQSTGVDEVGVLAAEGFGLGVHGVHKGGDGAGVPLRQNVAGLVGGDDEHTLQKLFHRLTPRPLTRRCCRPQW